ncbi:MAG TPA: M50 family metallopeptidase [Candidatus Limnocylindrales bacterium]|nr:M50 family metallopeptidase [Candidatus Limnocylindrales bacterium]
MSGVPIARILGIEVRLHLSWIFIIVIVTATVGGRLTSLQPAADPMLSWAIGIAASLLFMLTVIAHELAHALVSRRSGMAVESISVHFIGSPAVVDVRAATPGAEAAVAVAGPLTSLAIGAAAVALALVGVMSNIEPLQVVGNVLVIVGALDLVLAGVSLVPAFPLDGGRLVRAIGWARSGDPRRGALLAARVGRVVGWLLLAAGLGVILAAGLGVLRADQTLDGIMIGIIGWFLGASSRSVDRWVVMDGLIAEVNVSEAMEAELDTITPQLTLDTFGPQVLDGTLGPALPVLSGEELIGIVGAGQLRGVPRRDWPSTRTSEVMVGVADLPTLGPDESLTEGLERLRESRLDGLPVMNGADLRGVLTRRSIAVALRARADTRGVSL